MHRRKEMAETSEVDVNRIYKMLNHITESQTDLTEKLDNNTKQLDLKLGSTVLDQTNKLDQTKAEINTKIDDVKLDVAIKLNDTNFKVEQSVSRINEQLKTVTEAINAINIRCSAVEGKIDEK